MHMYVGLSARMLCSRHVRELARRARLEATSKLICGERAVVEERPPLPKRIHRTSGRWCGVENLNLLEN